MFLIEIFLPLNDSTGAAWTPDAWQRVRSDLTERFGGVTASARTPAVGLWCDERGRLAEDAIAILEVVADALDYRWWSAYRDELERRFAQREVLIRAVWIERL